MMTEIFLTFGTIKGSSPKARFYSQREKGSSFMFVKCCNAISRETFAQHL